MKQLHLIAKPRPEHGGIHAVGKRRSRRPLSTKHALHITLRSDHAKGERSLLKHKHVIQEVLNKGSRQFQIRVYRLAICSNHIHLLIRGKNRVGIQNFFRVFAGHVAQSILEQHPLKKSPQGTGCVKNQRKFWALLIYSRVVSWGREYMQVARYILQNTLEALNIIAYRPRSRPAPLPP